MPLDRNDANAGAQLPVTVGQIKRRIGSSVSDGLYEGKVAYTADPLNIGRIKVRIPLKNDLTGIELKDTEYSTGAAPVSSLPWAVPSSPSSCFTFLLLCNSLFLVSWFHLLVIVSHFG